MLVSGLSRMAVTGTGWSRPAWPGTGRGTDPYAADPPKSAPGGFEHATPALLRQGVAAGEPVILQPTYNFQAHIVAFSLRWPYALAGAPDEVRLH